MLCRKLKQKSVKVNGELRTEPTMIIDLIQPVTLQVGRTDQEGSSQRWIDLCRAAEDKLSSVSAAKRFAVESLWESKDRYL